MELKQDTLLVKLGYIAQVGQSARLAP